MTPPEPEPSTSTAPAEDEAFAALADDAGRRVVPCGLRAMPRAPEARRKIRRRGCVRGTAAELQPAVPDWVRGWALAAKSATRCAAANVVGHKIAAAHMSAARPPVKRMNEEEEEE